VLNAGVILTLAGCGHRVCPVGTVDFSAEEKAKPAESNSTKVGLGHFEHVVIIVQENRSTDNLFHDPVLMARGADIATTGVNSRGETIRLAPISLAAKYDLDHSHLAFIRMFDHGKMDGADQVGPSCIAEPCVLPANPQFKYVNPADVAPYFQIAEQYTFADRMFQTNQGPSFPAHQYLLAGTSQPTANSLFFVAENPNDLLNPSTPTGCTAPKEERVRMIGPHGNEDRRIYPCFEHSTLPDLLDAKGIGWRYYTSAPDSIWTAPNAIEHLSCGPDWTANVTVNQTLVLQHIAQGQLAAVTWVIPNGQASDHADATDGSGPSWVASIVNAVGDSPYWSNTAILITWDDWGGWYDHVAPRIISSYEYGFRVPLIVVSSYSKPGHISHVQHDFGSILKFIENNFGLASLGYADKPADDLSDCFDFNQRPLTFHPITAKYSAKYFLTDTRPPLPPDDD
jgi:phospholipase C